MNRRLDNIEELKDRCDLVGVISQVVSLKKTTKGYVGLCPFHQEGTPSFHVYDTSSTYYCFGCQKHGDVISFYQGYYNVSFQETLDRLAHSIGFQWKKKNLPPDQQDHRDKLYDILKQIGQYFHLSLLKLGADHPATQMLQQRRMPSSVIKSFQLGWSSPHHPKNLLKMFPAIAKDIFLGAGLVAQGHLGADRDRFLHRLVFPIIDVKGRIIGFGGRKVANESQKEIPKYLNSPETDVFKKNNELYGLYQSLENTKFKSFLIVEGYFDVLQCFAHQLPCAIAPMGTAFTQGHLDKLLRYQRELIFCFDGDEAGQEAAWKVVKLLLPEYHHQRIFSFVTLSIDHDPDSFLLEYGRAAFAGLVQKRIRLAEYLFMKLEEKFPLDNIDNRVKFFSEAKNLLNLIQDPDARVTLLSLVRSWEFKKGTKPIQPSSMKPVIPRSGPKDCLAAVFAKRPELMEELPIGIKDALIESASQHELKNLLLLPRSSPEFLRCQMSLLGRYKRLLEILPDAGLRDEVEYQLKNLGITLKY